MGQARVPLAAVGVQDPERRAATRWAVAVMGDERLGALADDVATEPDPRAAGQLEADAGRFVDRGREAAGQTTALATTGLGRVQDQQQGLGAPGERRKAMEAVGDLGRSVGPGQPAAGQVQHEEVDRPAGEEAPRDRQPLVETLGRDDDEPLEAQASGDGLDRVEAARQVEPGHDRALDLGLGGDPQRERRPAAGPVAADGDAGRAGQAARPEDRVERGEPGMDDPLVGTGRARRSGGGERVGLVVDGGCRDRRHDRRQGERPGDLRSCRTPAGPEVRDGRVHSTTGGRHRTTTLEHPF